MIGRNHQRMQVLNTKHHEYKESAKYHAEQWLKFSSLESTPETSKKKAFRTIRDLLGYGFQTH